MIEMLLLIIVLQISLSMYFYWFFQHKIHTKIDLSDIKEPISQAVRTKVKAFSKFSKKKPIVNDDFAIFKRENNIE